MHRPRLLAALRAAALLVAGAAHATPQDVPESAAQPATSPTESAPDAAVTPPQPPAQPAAADSPAAPGPAQLGPVPEAPPHPALAFLQAYALDYVLVAATGGLLASGVTAAIPPAPAVIGPRVDLNHVDRAALFDPRLDGVVGQPLLAEKISNTQLLVGTTGVVALTAAIDFAFAQDPLRTHALVLGSAEAIAAAGLITEGLKLSFGRLRPDFRDRWTTAACAGVVARPRDVACEDAAPRTEVRLTDVYDGMKSFPSGHAAISAAAATYLSLALADRWIRPKSVPVWGRPLAALGVGGLMALAGFTAASRLDDNRHHPEDVAVGAAIGIGTGTAAWLLHFDDGLPRQRLAIQPLAVPAGAGVSVTGPLDVGGQT